MKFDSRFYALVPGGGGRKSSHAFVSALRCIEEQVGDREMDRELHHVVFNFCLVGSVLVRACVCMEGYYIMVCVSMLCY